MLVPTGGSRSPVPPSSPPQLHISQGGLSFVLLGICINKPFELIKKKNQKQNQSHKCLESSWGCQPPPLVGGAMTQGPPVLGLGGYCF